MDNIPDSNQPVGEPSVQKDETPAQQSEQPVKNNVVPPWIAPSGEPAQQPEPPTPEAPDQEPTVKEEPLSQTTIKKSPFAKFLPLIVFLIIGIVVISLITKVVLPLLSKTKNGKPSQSANGEKITITYWGIWEAEEVIRPLIDEYQNEHSNITIKYLSQSYKDYRERLQSAFARNEGPDIFRFHNTWLAMLKKELAPAPSEIAQEINLEENYYPVVSENLKVGSQTFGVPLGFDSLALFYNLEIFKEAGKTFPGTWDELRRTAIDLVVYDQSGRIQTAGVALGTANNIDHFSDILALMMIQNGVDLTNPSGALAEDAIKFYTLFVTDDHVWDGSMPSSIQAFAAGKVAMVFAPSWRAHEIAQINPELKFNTVPVPQLPGTQMGWATYWAEGVSSKSENSQAAWEFLAYISSKESLVKFYTQASQLRGFGEPYPRKDMASQLEDDPIVGSFVKQGPYAKSWYLCSATHDNGINDKIIKYFEDAVNKVLNKEGATGALTVAAQGVAQVLDQYGIK